MIESRAQFTSSLAWMSIVFAYAVSITSAFAIRQNRLAIVGWAGHHGFDGTEVLRLGVLLVSVVGGTAALAFGAGVWLHRELDRMLLPSRATSQWPQALAIVSSFVLVVVPFAIVTW